MAAIKKRISTLVNKQLPDFISAEYPKFSAFLQKYYEQLELQGQPLDIIQNLTKYTDIDFYEKQLLSEFTTASSNINATATEIFVENTDSFPDTFGYILIDDEVIFYESKTTTSFVDCKRNVSGTTKLGDLYNSSVFKEGDYGNGENHLSGTQVFNISNLFLYAFVKNYETQYLASFPEESLKPEVDKRTLIKNIKQFYRAKGTDQSIRFIFNSIVAQNQNDIPSIYYPKDTTLKASTSNWINKLALRVKVISGDPFKIIGQKLYQEEDIYDSTVRNAFAVVDNVNFLGNYDGESIYEIALAPETVVGEFSIAKKTFLTKRLLPSTSQNNRINVFSTVGWKSTKGQIKIGNETFTYKDKNVNQFVIDNRSGNGDYPVNTPVYNYSNLLSEYEENGVTYSVKLLCYGVLYGVSISDGQPYSTEGDSIQISDSGFETRNPVIYDKSQSSVRWKINDSIATSNISGLNDVLVNVAAIYEDEQYYYIASSGLPSYTIGTFTNLSPQDQKHLKLIRKESIRNTELYPTPSKDIGIFLNGVLAYGYKDYDENDVIFGGLTHIKVTEKGRGYKNAPYVLIDGDKEATAKAILSGEVIERIEIINPGKNYTSNPAVTITSGRGAIVTATVTKDKVTKLTIVNPGEYYSTPPLIVIKDSTNNGRLAEYTSIISTDGKLIGFNKISEGKFYTQENISVQVVPIGKEAEATAYVKRWKRNRYENLKNKIDSENGYLFENIEKSFGYGYAHIANPSSLRIELLDTNSNNHSPIIGYAYDGNPIYGPYGYSNPLNPSSSVERMGSSWRLKTARDFGGPDIVTYPLGSFIEDYRYQHRFGSLDENNGRYCVTPDYPNGVYAYFITIDAINQPVFPYILGERFYGIPVESNYAEKISQANVPSKSRRLKTSITPNNGVYTTAIVETTTEGGVTSSVVESSPENFSVGNSVIINNNETSGSGLVAEVSSLKGKIIDSIESTQTKSIKITSKNPVYFFDKSIITQEDTNASGEIVGDIFSSDTFVLRNVTGQFNSSSKLNSALRIVNLIVDNPSFYTRNAGINLTNGKEVVVLSISANTLRVAYNPFQNNEGISFPQSSNGILKDKIYYIINATTNSFQVSETKNGNPLTLSSTSSFGIVATSQNGKGIILEQVASGNTVKVKVVDGDFYPTIDYYLRSEIIDDTIGSKIFQVDELSKGVEIFSLNNNIALVTTTDKHNITENDIVDIDIIPDDAITTTKYYVRKRIYQTVKLFEPELNAVIDDTGIGIIKRLNSGEDYANDGSSVFSNVELLFADQTQCRDENGLIVSPDIAFIGSEGAEGNAKATITVVDGKVTTNGVVITNKGSGYKIGDILTVKNSSLQRLSGSLSQSYLYLEVSHVGFGINNNQLTLTNVSSISQNDILIVNKEHIKVDSVNADTNTLTVTRGFNNTIRENHYNGNSVSFVDGKYTFISGNTLGGGSNSPIVKSYNREKQELTVVYNLDQTLNSIADISFNSSFFDNGTPAKLVSVDSVVSRPQYKFEFAKHSISNDWIPNPIIEIQKYYRYKFITSDSSLAGSFLEFSPSKNKNIVTTECIKGNVVPGSGDENSSYISVKFGFGDASPSNNYNVKQAIDFANFYYYDKSEIIQSDDSYLSLIDDPLQGQKVVTYVSPYSFAYDLTKIPEYDGSGVYTYTTTSIFADGEISKINITNSGRSYKKTPTVFGILPTQSKRCIAALNFDEGDKKIVSISVDFPGSNYINPKIVLDDDGEILFLKFNVVKGNNGEIIAIKFLQDYTFTKKPLIYVVEQNVRVFFGGNNIGKPKNLKVTYNGSNYYNDNTISSILTSHQILHITNFNSETFLNGEIVRQYEGGFLIAEGRISKDGFNPNKNFLKVENVIGEFKTNIDIVGNLKNKTAKVTKVFYSLFNSDVKSYFDNAGYYDTSKGHLSSLTDRISDSYFYQDYSYVVKSKTPINIWKKLVKQTVHPAGFKMFGEVAIDAAAQTQMPERQNVTSSISILELWDSEKNKVTIESTRRQITQTIVQTRDTNVSRGKGSVLVSGIDTTELLSYVFTLQQNFDGDFDESGNIVGRKSFNMILPGYGVMNVANANNLFITLDGIIQEPGVSYTISGSTITFATAPLGPRISNNQEVEAQKFVGRMIRFKNESLNNQYFRKIENIQKDFDNTKTRFPLYYEDGSSVILDAKENLLVSLDGVVQENKMTPLIPATSSYYIDRTKTPNEIVFVDAPRKLDSVNYTRFFAYSIGNYERLYIDNNLFNGEKKGPFTLTSVLGDQTVTIDNDRTVLIFIEGILQIRNRSYTITGSNIYFTEAPRPGQIINILYLYGRETEKKLTFYNFENNKFFNRIDLLSSAFITNDQLLDYDTVYQGNTFKNWESVGEILNSYASSDSQGNPTLRIIFRQQNCKFDITKPIKLTSYKKTVSEFIIEPSEINSITDYTKDDENNELVYKTKAGWMYGTELKPKYSNNLEVNDLVQVDGEKDYRRITLIPDVLKKLGHRKEDLIENNHYGQVGVTTYNGLTEGIGLSVLANTTQGKVTSLIWNNRNYADYAFRVSVGIIIPTIITGRNSLITLDYQNKVELRDGTEITLINPNASVLQKNNINIQPSAYNYPESPQLVFVPQPPRDTYGNITGPVTGGGASGFVVMNGGEIIDVVLTNGGSGYSVPPKVYVTRGYNIYRSKEKVVSSRTDLILSPNIRSIFGVYTQWLLDIGSKLVPDIVNTVDVRSAYNSTNPTIVVTPKPLITPIVENKKEITSIINLEPAVIDSISDISYQRLSFFQFDPLITTIDVTKTTTVIADFGAIDTYGSGVDNDKYEFAQLGNRFEIYENIKFMTDYGVANVSQQNTLEMMDIYYPTVTIGDFADRGASSLSASGDIWQLSWPTINEYGALLDISLTETDTIVYVPNTNAFPSSGKLLIGDEIITYTGKLSDRFIGVVRGADNTIAKTHNAGDYLRSLQ